MTPRERAVKGIESSAINDFQWWALQISADQCKALTDAIEQAILADRQALQSEIVAVLEKERNASIGAWLDWSRQNLFDKIVNAVQSVFAQQSQPEAGKPHAFQGRSDRWCEICNQPDRAEIHKALVDMAFQQSVIEAECNRRVSQVLSGIAQAFCGGFRIINDDPPTVEAVKDRIDWLERRVTELEQECGHAIRESDRRVLAERKACKDAVKAIYQKSIDENARCEYLLMAIDEIRARSNHPEGKPEENTKIKTVPIETHENLDAYAFYVKKVNDWQSTRIATLQEWLATDAKIIQQLNESNNALSLKVAQLEKENHELTEELTASNRHVCAAYCDACKSPANRKA